MKTRIFVLAVAMVMCFAGHSASAAPPDFSVGRPFPNLVLPALDGGRAMSIADFRGKQVILHVFASW